ncbi:hypothetical protein NPIL_284391 [Nephila pilipes]|uniref:Uncharacterized protein n=1 Tax=Nephila pilipes TaxID=299642 RepID=A0A8X6TZM7_NEPPI|nr:hypothetical protein NPIL_284391 [Nephila pilipes]
MTCSCGLLRKRTATEHFLHDKVIIVTQVRVWRRTLSRRVKESTTFYLISDSSCEPIALLEQTSNICFLLTDKENRMNEDWSNIGNI